MTHFVSRYVYLSVYIFWLQPQIAIDILHCVIVIKDDIVNQHAVMSGNGYPVKHH